MNSIIADIKKGNIKPIYFLMGDEPYYIDKISNFIENNILSEEERGFNQMLIYGRDASIDDIVSNAKRFPMMAERQVIIVKEAQDLSRTIENLVSYVENPQPTTVLVFCYKYKKLDARKKLAKTIKKTDNVLFESKKLYDNQVVDWIKKYLSAKNYNIEPKAVMMLVEFLGVDLSKISNELNKLMIVLSNDKVISPLDIETNIGISKDYNNFELRKAISTKQIVKANAIINYFKKNDKVNPIVVTIALLNDLFTKLLLFHGLKDKSQNNVARKLGVNPFFVKEYFDAAKNYPMRKVSQIISMLHEA
ncbi:MAG TPA: DNA polymerase III subunit delta, partial [Flavobacteriaceae bacterium]|nr:DNA polymerase III subunit delta [Flavobacteriaceae bacterium]